MNLAEVAERLRRSKRTVMRMVDEGRFPRPVIRRGHLIEFNDRAIERYFRRHRNGGTNVKPPARRRVVKGASRAERPAS